MIFTCLTTGAPGRLGAGAGAGAGAYEGEAGDTFELWAQRGQRTYARV